ncbi:MAG: hypothetical protein LQ343_004771 [Gyalolechia ehrenbergii]|nr:MAG: hypothetical protein LQ343_004771 [Gyalolechia ehrenbergii]
MSSISSSLSNLTSSFLSIIRSIFDTFYSAFETLFATTSALIGSIVDLFSGFVGFVLGNIVIIGFLVAAFVAYSAYQQKQGRNKKGVLKSV